MRNARQIIVHLPPTMTAEEHAELANGIWSVAFGADSVEVLAPDQDEVHEEMDRLWKTAPEWHGQVWRKPRR